MKWLREYLALKKRLKNRNEEERSDIIDHQRDLEENFEPVVASNNEMAKEVVNELMPITKELQQLNNKAMQTAAPAPAAPRIGVKRDSSSKPKRVKRHVPNTYGPLAETFMKKYMHTDLRKQEIDTTFGIRYENSRGWMIGKKDIEIDVDDIIIDGEVYISTPVYGR